MQIYELYSSIDTFRKIIFNPGLNLVIGDKATNKGSTSGHNVGKTTFIKILDYLIFYKKDKKYYDGWLKLFEGELFYLKVLYASQTKEIALPITKKLMKADMDSSIGAIYPELSFLLRYKSEYDDEFRRPSYRGKDIKWKPFVFSVLGFDSKVMATKMQNDIDYQNTDNVIKAIEVVAIKDSDKTNQILLLKEEAEKIQRSMKDLDFFHFEKELFSKKLISLNSEYSIIKTEIYRLETNKSAAEQSLGKQIATNFNLIDIEKIFSESNIILSSGAKRSFEELVEFNHQITESRRKMLSDVISDISNELSKKRTAIEQISIYRMKYANILAKKDFKETYESLQNRLLEIENEIGMLSVQVMKKSKEEFISKKNILESQVAESKIALRIEKEKLNEKFNKIQQYYTYLVKRILKINAVIELSENGNGNIDFNTRIQDASIDMLSLNGDVFKRISCGVLDLSIAATFPERESIVLHDGLIDGIATPIKVKYLYTARAFAKLKGFQYILTGINEGIPKILAEKCVIRFLRDKPENELLLGKSY